MESIMYQVALFPQANFFPDSWGSIYRNISEEFDLLDGFLRSEERILEPYVLTMPRIEALSKEKNLLIGMSPTKIDIYFKDKDLELLKKIVEYIMSENVGIENISRIGYISTYFKALPKEDTQELLSSLLLKEKFSEAESVEVKFSLPEVINEYECNKYFTCFYGAYDRPVPEFDSNNTDRGLIIKMDFNTKDKEYVLSKEETLLMLEDFNNRQKLENLENTLSLNNNEIYGGSR